MGSARGRNTDDGSTHPMVRKPSAKHTANLRPSKEGNHRHIERDIPLLSSFTRANRRASHKGPLQGHCSREHGDSPQLLVPPGMHGRPQLRRGPCCKCDIQIGRSDFLKRRQLQSLAQVLFRAKARSTHVRHASSMCHLVPSDDPSQPRRRDCGVELPSQAPRHTHRALGHQPMSLRSATRPREHYRANSELESMERIHLMMTKLLLHISEDIRCGFGANKVPRVRSCRIHSLRSHTGRGISSGLTSRDIVAIANATDGSWKPLPRAATAVAERLSTEKRAAEEGHPMITVLSLAIGSRHLSADQ